MGWLCLSREQLMGSSGMQLQDQHPGLNFSLCSTKGDCPTAAKGSVKIQREVKEGCPVGSQWEGRILAELGAVQVLAVSHSLPLPGLLRAGFPQQGP